MWELRSTTIRERILAVLAGIAVIIGVFRFVGENDERVIPLGTWVNLGNVSLGQTSERKFSIVNTSARAIEILRWIPTCQCMKVRFAQAIIAPHEKVDAFVETTAVPPLGARAAVVTIKWHYSGEQFERTDKLVASARYISSFLLSDQRLNFGTIQGAHGVVKMLEVRRGNSDVRWNDLEAESDSEDLSVALSKNTNSFQLQSRLNPKILSAGIWKSKIRLFPLYNGKRTGDEMDVPVVARVEGPFAISPPVIQFASKSGRLVAFTLRIRAEASLMSSLRFEGDLVQDPKVVMLGGGREAVMTGNLSVPDDKGVCVGKIPIRINDDPGKVLNVSFLGCVDDKAFTSTYQSTDLK